MSLPLQGFLQGLSLSKGELEGKLKNFSSDSVVHSRFQSFPISPVGHEKTEECLSLKSPLEWKQEGTLKVITEKSIQAFQVLLGSSVILLSSSVSTFYRRFGKNAS